MKIVLLFLFLVLQVGIFISFTQLRERQTLNNPYPNLYDPLCEIGEINVDDGNYYINNFRIRIGRSQFEYADYNEDGKFRSIWEELWYLQGKKVLVEGHRGRNVEEYEHIFITSIKLIKE